MFFSGLERFIGTTAKNGFQILNLHPKKRIAYLNKNKKNFGDADLR